MSILKLAINTKAGWLGVPVGGYITSAVPPPKDDPSFRYILCTAGHNGAGGYNEGCTVNEVVTGVSPKIDADGLISLYGSPMYGQTIRFVNTTREFFRPGTEDDVPQLDMILQHDHAHGLFTQGGSNVGAAGASYTISSAGPVSGPPANRIGDESRPRNIPITYYQRIL